MASSNHPVYTWHSAGHLRATPSVVSALGKRTAPSPFPEAGWPRGWNLIGGVAYESASGEITFYSPDKATAKRLLSSYSSAIHYQGNASSGVHAADHHASRGKSKSVVELRALARAEARRRAKAR